MRLFDDTDDTSEKAGTVVGVVLTASIYVAVICLMVWAVVR
jgi:hypothetical protein